MPDAALHAVRHLIGQGFDDLAYRGVASNLNDIDCDWT